jgi:hypothetical protein
MTDDQNLATTDRSTEIEVTVRVKVNQTSIGTISGYTATWAIDKPGSQFAAIATTVASQYMLVQAAAVTQAPWRVAMKEIVDGAKDLRKHIKEQKSKAKKT